MPSPTLLNLPLDLLIEHILPRLDPPALYSLGRTSSAAHALVLAQGEDAERLWRNVARGWFDGRTAAAVEVEGADGLLADQHREDRGAEAGGAEQSRRWGRSYQAEVQGRWRALREVQMLAEEQTASEKTAGSLGGSLRLEDLQELIRLVRTARTRALRVKEPSDLGAVQEDEDGGRLLVAEEDDQEDGSLNLKLLEEYSDVLRTTLVSRTLELGQPIDSISPSTSPSSPFPSSTRPRRSNASYASSSSSHRTELGSPTLARQAELQAISHLLALLSPVDSRSVPVGYTFLSSSLVYSIRTHSINTRYGPFLPIPRAPSHALGEAQDRVDDVDDEYEEQDTREDELEVDWALVQAITQVVARHIELEKPEDENEQLPLDMQDIRPTLLPKQVPNDYDWAGVEGTWTRVVCFLDYRDFILFNYDQAMPANFFVRVRQAVRFIPMTLSITSFSRPPSPPPRSSSRPSSAQSSPASYRTSPPSLPIIHFRGKALPRPDEPPEQQNQQGGTEVRGFAQIMPGAGGDGADCVRWSLTSFRDGRPLWSSEAVQPGGPRSRRGLAGLWTGAHHLDDDPIGPFLMWKTS